jgi:predicted signal transduction protein with EAL and GGDEF domain
MEDVRKMAYSDSGTRLNNRHWLEREISNVLAELPAARHAELSIVVFALRRMDILVGTYGRETVAAMLRKIGLALQRAGWVCAVGARSGAGQLVCLCREPQKELLENHIWGILKKNEYMTIGELSARISLQAGICYFAGRQQSISEAMSCADLAAHEARPVRFFDASLQEHMAFNQQIESSMEAALSRKEFEVWYQPKYDIRTHACIGAEALVRWRSPRLGFLMPGKFIDLFERNGFVVRLDFYMLEEAFRLGSERCYSNFGCSWQCSFSPRS